MPWLEVSAMQERREFVRLALQEGANRRELCRRFGISADVGYKWLARWGAGDTQLVDRSRRPHASPSRTGDELEAAVLQVRDAHPVWGARKIGRLLERQGTAPPAVSTIHEILRRHGRIPDRPGGAPARLRFEMEAPNLLWQMDFKGWVELGDGTRCHPLTVIDDHARFSVCLSACSNQTGSTVRQRLETTFRLYGLPDALFVDNGPPWGDSSGERWTRFEVWLLKLGIGLIHSRPYHPQSRGKNERFHRTLAAEVFALNRIDDLTQAQKAFDRWREVYNFERPHEALDLQVPADRYRPSPRPLPEKLAEPDYEAGEIVRHVPPTKPYISFKGRRWRVPRAFCGERLAVRPADTDGHYHVCFASHHVADIDLTQPETVSHVSEQVSAISPD
jgi:transposase InsO family protein